MKIEQWEHSEVTLPLREQIESYIAGIIDGNIPQIPLEGYLKFRDHGSRKESEDSYFEVRKQLTALGLYLQWKSPEERTLIYFNELLWTVANEFTWCLAAHLSYGEQYFTCEPQRTIDLFAAETAETLSELLVIHKGIIDPYLAEYLRKQIKDRVLTPFLKRSWNWEVSKSNWCAVCSGSIGMAALLLERGERRKQILDKVDHALKYYLEGFGEDGATEEGIGYWVYGFGYYIYYTAMRQELDPEYRISRKLRDKIRKIGCFPGLLQISEDTFVPFSDAAPGSVVPTGLSAYLYKEYGSRPPVCSQITTFDFDHCYRFAHISRNLLWTDQDIFKHQFKDFTHYFKNRQWLIQRTGQYFLAVKGGNNTEEHNHNDVGSFVLAMDGELILTDLGAGSYSADYFSENRYENVHTRSYWHNIPLINGREQIPTSKWAEIEELSFDEIARLQMELSGLYEVPELESFKRSWEISSLRREFIIKDKFIASDPLEIEEGLISKALPELLQPGMIRWKGRKGSVILEYPKQQLNCSIRREEVCDHRHQLETIYRLCLRTNEKSKFTEIILKLIISP